MPKTFKDWYQENKDALSKKRRERYATDLTYRQSVKERAADFKLRKRLEAPKNPVTGITREQACAHLKVTEWTLNKWRQYDYYPEPGKSGGRTVFTVNQLALLNLIKEFFVKYPRRASASRQDELKTLVEVIHHNWS